MPTPTSRSSRPSIVRWPAADRFRTSDVGRETWHSFSFGEHFDPARTSFGPLTASNEDLLEPGAGYGPHPHRDVEIVTWMVSGTLHHDAGQGRRGVLTPGCVQALSAGSGVTHSERAGPGERAHLLQMWLATDAPALPPAYATGDVSGVVGDGGWAVLASGRPEDRPAVRIRQHGACLRVARPRVGVSLRLPPAALRYVQVVRGEVRLEGCALGAGDAALVSGDAAGQVTTDTGPAELLVWGMTDGVVEDRAG